MRLMDRVCLVTGGGSGIGKAICKKVATEGAKVIVADLLLEKAKRVSDEIRSEGGEAVPIQVDVTQFLDVKQMVEKAENVFGQIDVLVNNAGWSSVEAFLESDESTWDKEIDINLKGVLYTCKTVLPIMIKQGYGKVINISSEAGVVGAASKVVYSAAKGGVISFTKALAREMARHNITVNSISPGVTKTPLLNELESGKPGLISKLEKLVPLRRLAEPEDIANTVCLFASYEGDYITGQTLSVSGGITMH